LIDIAGGALAVAWLLEIWRVFDTATEAFDRLLSFGVARSGFVHEGAARVLVHRLKYEAVPSAGRLLATEGMAHLVPHDAAALIPIPRTRWRAIRYGVDPAMLLAEQLADLTGLPLAKSLTPALFGRRHAGRVVSQRDVPAFGARDIAPARAVLIDDVLTTGITLETAAAALGGAVVAAVTATVSV
jgi:predicted amidophosphoribosyltransferase